LSIKLVELYIGLIAKRYFCKRGERGKGKGKGERVKGKGERVKGKG
jgi:hypothetical protein